jgi:hypothetical protein
MDHTVTPPSTRDRLRWAVGSIALIMGLASVAAATHDGPWMAAPVATLDAMAAPAR